MKFDLISDMHVEMNRAWADHPAYDGISSIYPWHLEKQADTLVIAGDNANDVFTSVAVVDEAKQWQKKGASLFLLQSDQAFLMAGARNLVAALR